MSKRYFAFLFAIFLYSNFSYAQQSVVTVDPVTGSLAASIPICTISNGAASTSVSISYTGGNGIKVKDVEGSAGIGWQVTGGGAITREVRGLPDDVLNNYAPIPQTRLGWLNGNIGSTINSFSIANTGSPNCTNETTDKTNINNSFANYSDTEPDVFSINAPGLSCKFMFDNNKAIRTIPYQDIRIDVEKVNSMIKGFTITNDKGVKYIFGMVEGTPGIIQNTLKQTTNVLDSVLLPEDSIKFFRHQYFQYKGGVNYSSNWPLMKIQDRNGNKLVFNYVSPELAQGSATATELYIGETTKKTLFWTTESFAPITLASITNGSSTVEFAFANNYRTSVPMIKSIKVNDVKYLLNYSEVSTPGTKYYRYFLRELVTDQCNNPFRYNFSYYGETYHSTGIPGQYAYNTTLRDSTAKSIDFWGYQTGHTNNNLAPALLINPSNTSLQRYQIYTDSTSRSDYPYSISGSDRRADPITITSGALKQITYFNSGNSLITYEPNSFYDPTANIAVSGGGIRVKKVTEYDGLDSTRNMVSNYAYNDPATGVTSGKAISLPVYSFTIPYTGGGTTAAKWASSTARSELDLSPDDHSILYTHVTLSQAGAGKTLYEYNVPATNYDNSAIPTCDGCTTPDWEPNLDYVAGPGCAPAGFVSSTITTYPFAPALNYDFERGLIKKETSYNEAGQVVSQTSYKYQRTDTPLVTTAFKFDYVTPGITAYLKYKIYTGTSELIKQVTTKVFDLNSTSVSQETDVQYAYTSPYHKLPTQTTSYQSDGSSETNHIKYSKDYVISSSNENTVEALQALQFQNVNTPIETFTDITKNGDRKITAAQLVKYNAFGVPALYLPYKTLNFFDQNGVAYSSFDQSTVFAGYFINDSRYIVTENSLVYDKFGFVQTKNDDHKRVQTTLADTASHLPLASIMNAKATEIGFYSYGTYVNNSNFDLVNGVTGTSAGRTVQSSLALTLHTTNTLRKTVVKNSSTSNYIFSTWAKDSGFGAFTIVLTGSDNVPHAYSLNLNGTGIWKYYELKLPVSALSSTFKIEITANVSLPIDDVLFYPDIAEATTFKYDAVSKAKIADSNTNGISNYYVSDAAGRLELVYDQDKNVTQRKLYGYPNNTGQFYDPSFSVPDNINITTTTALTFNSAFDYNTCQFAGVKYTWDFGDGSPAQEYGTNVNVIHTFATADTFTVTLTITIPGYGSKAMSKQVIVLPPIPPPPLVIPVLYVNNSTTGGAITEVRFLQSGIVKYSFTGAELATGTVKVPEGNFTIIVNVSGTVGSVAVNAYSSNECLDSQYPAGTYPAFTVNLSNGTSITFTVNDGLCL